MRLGICGGIERVKGAKENGFDYMEPGFGSVENWTEEEYQSFKEELKKYSMGCDCMNGFIPGDLKTVGPDVDYDKLSEYLDKGFKRANGLGVKTVVYGSGGSRRIPEGYSYYKAVNDIIYFVKRYAAPKAAEYGIYIVFEPLCKKETNIINTVKEGSMLAAAINEENVYCLADIYHCVEENDTWDDIKDLKGIIKHAHISNPVSEDERFKRQYLKSFEDFDYKGFVDAVKFAGCETISVEANTSDFDKDVISTGKILNALAR